MAAGAAGRAGLRAPDTAEYLFCALFALVAAVSWAALTLAELRVFSGPRLLLLSLALIVAGAVWSRRAHLPRPSLGLPALLWVLALAATGASLTRPVESLVDGADENIYRHLASLITHRGGLAVNDRLLASTPPEDWQALLMLERHWPHRLNRFDGGIQAAAGQPRLEPNFLHLLPAWIAAVMVIGGPAAAPWAGPLLALLSPVALFLVVRRLFTTEAAVAASALLVTNSAQVWAGRLPLSELPAQLFVVSGIFFFVWWLSDRSALPALFAGVAFGLAALSRLDTLILIIPFVAAVLAIDSFQDGRTNRGIVATALGVLLLQAVLHSVTVSLPYPLRLVRHMARDDSLAALGALAAAVNVALGVIALVRLSGRRLPSWAIARAGQLAAVSLLAWLAWRIGAGFTTHHLVLALTPFGAIVACIGVVWLAGKRDLGIALVTTLLLASSVAYVESARDSPELPGVLRRDIPVLLPLSLLAVGALLFPAGARPPRRFVGVGAAMWLMITGAAHVPVVWLESSGIETRRVLDDLASTFPPDALVVVEPGLPTHLDLALDFTFDRTALTRRHGEAAGPAVRAAITRTVDARAPVFIIARDGSAAPPESAKPLAGLALEPTRTVSLPVDGLLPSLGAWPDTIEHVVYPLSVYQARNIASLPWHVDIGGQDYGALGTGWREREAMLGATGRWTTGAAAEIAIPALKCVDSPSLTLHARLATLRPDGLPQPAIRLAVNDELVGLLTPEDSGFRVYALALPPALARQVCRTAATMTLVAPEFVPRRDAGLLDDRSLGVAIDWVEIDGRQMK
jgi:dolichyl-phosphate-mannose-protein mannosyltransferase